jgi:hypothetical protein
VGQIVTMNATLNDDGTTGTSSDVSFVGDVEGPATQIDPAANTFVVLGQTVRVTGSTLFDDAIQPADLTGLQPGSAVEISGFANSSGEIVASRVDLKAASAPLQVKGLVENLDLTAQTFTINSLTVDFNGSSVNGTLANGTSVEVHGTTVAATGELLATHIEMAQGLGAVHERVDLAGIITDVTSLLEFVLDGQKIIVGLDTQLVLHGIQLGLNVEVDVKGTIVAPGVVLASKIEVRPQGMSLLSGLVESVSSSADTLTVSGVAVTTSASTKLVDDSTLHDRLFGLSDLRVGDYVEVRGMGQAGTLTAATLRRGNLPHRLKTATGP